MLRRAVLNMRDERPVWAPPAWVNERLRAALPDDWELIEVAAAVSGRGDGGGLSPEALAAVHGAEIYFGLGLPRPLLLAALEPPRKLRWIHTGAAGVASLLHPELSEHDITLTNSAGIHAAPMAETVVAMMLHFARGFDYAVRAQQRAQWVNAAFERADSGVREISGASVGIIGYGGIGRAVGARARALGMHVLALRRSNEVDDSAQFFTGDDALGRLLEQSDFVVLTVPATTETRGLIGDAQLTRMRRGAVLINVARGNVVDSDALRQALRTRRLRGAALDVFDNEPLPADDELWQLENVLITPHISATTPYYWEREAELMLDNLRRYLAGGPLRNVVDRRAGY